MNDAYRLRVRGFIAAARLAAHLFPFRGKTHALLLLYKVLGLRERHIVVSAHLRRPVPFRAELDLHAWLQRVAFITGDYEHETVEFLLKLHRMSDRGGYLLDVGANIGMIAIPFALKVAARSPVVLAVEAVPDNAEVLHRNIAANNLTSDVPVLSIALGATSGLVQIQVEGDLRAGEGTGTANILPADSTYDCVRQEIAVSTLDEEAAAKHVPSGCSVIKIDTDGYDLKVLQGATQFLHTERPLIFGEFSQHCLGWHGQSLADVVAFGAANGYEVWRRILPGWRFARHEDVADQPYSQDLLLVPAERVAVFSELLTP